MPQEFQVLRCFNCEKFQAHQTKKAKKWICKVCGEKQSYIRIYFTGSAPQCRSIVQENNFKAGEMEISQILAESPNYFPENNQIENEFDDELNPYNHASKKLKSEMETSIATEDFQLDLACFSEEENSFINESYGAGDYYKNENQVLPKKLDLIRKQPLTTENSNSKELLPHSTCNKSDSYLEPEVPKIKPQLVRNQGFQKILKAAEKFN